MSRADEQQVQIDGLIGSKYEVLCRIGGGGMAQVLLARHRLHGGLFAIKILADHLAQDPSIVSRFKQEATTAASLSGHPNIVSIFDIGEGAGLHYLVMQFVCGEDLASYLRREGRLSPQAAAGVIAQAAEALAWAESKRVVHRDLKPANMHLDTAGRVTILDFGISKITDMADGLTRPGESLGTPFYMSPEQIRGEGCDVRSDLYSLGVVFFELLTGRRPFQNDSATAIQMAHLATPPPSLLEFDPGLPPTCETIVQKLLRKDRNERYQHAQELLDELHAHGASSGPTVLRPLIDPELQARIDRGPGTATHAVLCPPTPAGPDMPLPGSDFVEAPATPARTPAPVSAPIGTAAATLPPERSTAVAETFVPAAAASAASSKLLPLAMGSAVVLLLAIAGLLYALRTRHADTPSPAVAGAVTSALPAILDDPHGRMLLISAGPFIFGNNAPDPAYPRQALTLPAFYIDQTEVSNAEYLEFVQATGRVFVNAAQAAAKPQEPVTAITEQDAQAYATWAGKRLPTEQEWEKAARGTDGRPFPWGSEPWTTGVPDTLQPVTSFADRKSPYGALNMAGNAWEWTDTRSDAGEREFADMKAASHSDDFSRTWYTLKGGSFSPRGSAGFAVYLHRGFPQDKGSPFIGFRCAKSVTAGGAA